MEYLPFTFDAASEKPLYQQLYAYLAAQIHYIGLAGGNVFAIKENFSLKPRAGNQVVHPVEAP